MGNPITEFEFSDIEDVRIIIKAKGKHFGIVPKKDTDREDAKQMRIALLFMLLKDYLIVNTSLEEIKVAKEG